ncbi:MAG: DUF3300 domain-containing protein [Aestuariivirga sp.]|nr:DUF3300 domain-containing protein [Aestuariivirga sp.]
MQTTFLTRIIDHRLILSAAIAASLACTALPVRAETPPEAAVAVEQVAEPLSAEELEILVARIALYPDELIAVISAASLFPLQIVEAERFLEDSKTKKDLKPKATWDGSVVSLLNYPQIVAMMSEDLDWTQLFGEAIVNQQDDVLGAIQQLREEAVANGVIKSDEKVKVVKQEENIIIQPASKEVIYVPQYEPEMLYEPGYVYQPITYYPDPYPYYWNPAATFFAGAVTGAVWAAAVDWDDGFWGGDWNDWNNWGGNNNIDIDFDCNKCIIGNDFNGKLNFNDVDWTKIDRSKISFDKNKFQNIDNSKFKNSFKNNDNLKLNNKVSDIKGNRPATLPGKGDVQTKDIRKSTLDKLKNQQVKDFKPSDKMARPANNLQKPANNLQRPDNKMAKPANLDRPVGKPKPAAKRDNRPKNVSPLGEVTRSRDAIKQSNRGNKAMGGGFNPPKMGGGGGGGGKKMQMPKHKMSGGGGGRGRGRRG